MNEKRLSVITRERDPDVSSQANDSQFKQSSQVCAACADCLFLSPRSGLRMQSRILFDSQTEIFSNVFFFVFVLLSHFKFP